MSIKQIAKFTSGDWIIEQSSSNSLIWSLSCTRDNYTAVTVVKKDINNLQELLQAALATYGDKTEWHIYEY